LRRLAGAILHRDFPRLQHLEETADILHAALLRLVDALQAVRPTTVRDYFRLSAELIGRTLLDMARYHDRRPVAEGLVRTSEDESRSGRRLNDPANTTFDPVKLAEWTEFHRRVEELTGMEREVVQLHFYEGLSQRETAKLMGLSQATIHRLWVGIRLKLAGPMA
jgi:RNA polymerase sigma factor (sigma-70 family)